MLAHRRPLLALLTAAALTVTAAGAHAASSSDSGSAFSPELPQSVIAASSAPGSRWRPEPAIYGTASENDVPVTMNDGTVLRVNVIYPTDASGAPAKGRFPVLLTQTPYGKGSGGSSAPGTASSPGGGSGTGGADNYLVQRGYIEVVADVRGTGDSEGTWGIFDPIQTQDGITLVRWAAALPHSSGAVGTYGPSYLGINQLLLAGAIGKNSPLKATFPVVAANDLYRDTSFMGGLVDVEFGEAYLGLTGALNTTAPFSDAPAYGSVAPGQLANVEAQHVGGLANYHAAFTANTLSGGPVAYDGTYWQARNPANVLANVVANGIPAYLVGGEFDIFQHGEPLNYAALQNAYVGRPTTAPMLAGQKVTGRYQLVDGPWEHLNGSSVDVDRLELEWFDTWLKGEATGMDRTPTPLHYYDLGTGRFTETTTFPFAGAKPTRLYLGAGSLNPTAPTAATGGTDTLVWTGGGSPCGRPVDQWSMGALSVPSASVGVKALCAEDDRTTQGPPTATSYTTASFKKAATIAGPLSATIFATATTNDTEWVVEVDDVGPDGSSRPLTEGALLGSLRAVENERSWTAPSGDYLLPYHPYTQASSSPVAPGVLTRYDVEIFPTFATIKRGHALRVTVSTADVPHLAPTQPAATHLAGGIYTLQRTPAAASAIEVPLIPCTC